MHGCYVSRGGAAIALLIALGVASAGAATPAAGPATVTSDRLAPPAVQDGGVAEFAVEAGPIDAVRGAIAELLRPVSGGAGSPVTIGGAVTVDSGDLVTLYRSRAWYPLWIGDDGTIDGERAAAVLAVLADAAAEGLEPRDYFVEALEAMLASGTRPAETELLLSAAVMRYGADLHAGRIAPREIDRNFDIDPRPVDRPAIAVAAAIMPDPQAYLASLAPQTEAYAVLRAELAALRIEQQEAAAWPEVPGGPALRPGMVDDRVAVLRARLEASGHHPLPSEPAASGEVAADPMADLIVATEEDPTDPRLYDEGLVASVRAFQHEAGLVVDGIVGRDTLAALNAGTPINRLESVIATMERMRWLPEELGEDHLMVNIADFRLEVVQDGVLVREMDVIVGRPDRQTPLFNSALTYLEFNPTWTMPTSIAVRDYLPRLKRDPSYLDRNGYALYSSWGSGAQQMNSSWIDWYGVGSGIRNFRIVQPPGPGNALGKVKFMMENNWSVYLHDTPDRDLFNRDVRSFSSGCVRLEDPIWLADHLLAGSDAWDEADRERILGSWRPTTRIDLPEPMPLYLVYETAVVDPTTSEVRFRSDIYGFDRLVLDAVEHRSAGLGQMALLD